MEMNQMELWTFEELVDKVRDLKASGGNFSKSLGGEIVKYLEDFSKNFDVHEYSKVSKAWLSWCNSQKKTVKVSSEDIPKGILGQRLEGILHDVKVQSKGPDDAAYNKNSDLREKVARGNTILHIQDHENKSDSYDGVIFALRKFTGGMGDEDENQPDDNFVWMKYFLRPISTAQTVVCTRKANGEAAHLSVRYLPRTGFVLCVGSKNVHMIVRNKSDIQKYSSPRFLVARTVAETVLDLVMTSNDLASKNFTLLLNFLHHTKLTAVFEILQPNYQHVEDLSYLGDRSELNLITFTSPYSEISKDDSLCALSPDVVIEFGRAVGLQTVSYEVIEAEGAESRMEMIRKGYGYEGEVLYFMDPKSRVIGLVKKKTAWYVVARAIREKASHHMSELRKHPKTAFDSKKVENRIKTIQTWIGFDDTFRKAWVELGIGFIQWLIVQVKIAGQFHDGLNVRGKFPILWKRFLEEKQANDNILWS